MVVSPSMAAAAASSSSLSLVPLLLLLLGYAIAAVNAQTQEGIIPLGSSLSPPANGMGVPWLSPSRRFAFGFYPVEGGFSIGVWLTTAPEKTIVWTANRDDPPVGDGTLRLTFDGRLVWSAPGGLEKPISKASEAGASAAMLDSGDFVLYNSGGRVVWSTFDSPTDTLLPGQSLLPGSELFSKASELDWSTGKFRLKMQNDGNLVLYPVDTTDTITDAYWDSGTFMAGIPLSLNLTVGGSLYLSGNSSKFFKNLTLAEPSGNRSEIYYRATLETDGIFRLYSHSSEGGGISSTPSVVWEALKDRCLVKGTCGPNSYCEPAADGDPNCLCPLSFEFIDPNNKWLGCRRNSTTGNCRGTGDKAGSFSMATMEDTFWVDQPYSVLSSTSVEECKAACLGDCFCEAALFQDGRCTPQMLPLRYGRKSQNSTAFIKVAGGSGGASAPGEYPYGEFKIERKKVRVDVLVICVVLAASSVVIFAVSAALICRYRREGWRSRYSGTESCALDEDNPTRSFSFEELQTATEFFKEELGRGAFGTVFKGRLANGGKLIAVKRLDKMVEDGEREFQREVRAIGRTHHRNLVRLVGFCNEGSNRLLVYEYMSNGSLADLLFKGNTNPSWHERIGIAVDVARGLRYLHEDLDTHIIHCDIKPQNILMDDSRTAKISDFGLAKLMMPDQTKTFTGIRGTRGYLAPEWHKNSPITVRTDVYSFGVVLLEIVCRRRSMELEEAGLDVTLAEDVYKHFRDGELQKLLNGEVVDERELERVVKAGIWCVQNDPACRPSMKSVILMLEGNMEVPVPPSPTSPP